MAFGGDGTTVQFGNKTSSFYRKTIMLTFRLCVSAILAGKKPATIPAASEDSFLVATMPPPPPKNEAAPSERDGVIWSPGYWKFANNWFVWCAGHWELSRPGQSYRAPHWEHYADGWHFHPGAWRADAVAGKSSKKQNDDANSSIGYDVLGAFR